MIYSSVICKQKNYIYYIVCKTSYSRAYVGTVLMSHKITCLMGHAMVSVVNHLFSTTQFYLSNFRIGTLKPFILIIDMYNETNMMQSLHQYFKWSSQRDRNALVSMGIKSYEPQ